MATNVLGYDSQKCILQYLEPNLRIQLSIRCPSTRAAEKTVPLRIDHLSFDGLKTEINVTTYQLGLYFHYPPGIEIPEQHSNQNDEGGCSKDLDQFGMEDHSFKNMVTPGDVDLCRKPRHLPTPGETQRRYRLLEALLQFGEGQLRDGAGRHAAEVCSSHANLRRDLESFHRRRNNVVAPFTCYIQLTVHSTKGETIERVNYSKKLPEALKYLNTVLIGARPHGVHVNQLCLLSNSTIYRFPIGLKLKVKTIKSELIEYHRLDQIINSLDYPTINLHVIRSTEPADLYNQPAVHQAKSLYIYNERHAMDLPYYAVLKALQTKQVTLYKDLEMLVYIFLVGNWIEIGKPIGSIYTFGLYEDRLAKMVLKYVRRDHEERVVQDQERSITLAMPTHRSQLRIYYERILPQPEQQDGRLYDHPRCNLVMKVEELVPYSTVRH